ncbi:MAG: leucine--tRNA ligase [Polyangiaceae bacterium]
MSDREDRDRYAPAEIEPKWQRRWDEEKSFAAIRHPGRPKVYVLDMFPYPSGSGLHVGHPEGYTATDIYARYKRMRGFDVLHPMGWDAFGLPAEQHAIQTGTHPSVTTQKNIATFRRQLKSLGFSYDWSREVDTTDPGYVKWTQWVFLQLYKKGLAFQSNIPVNWCPALGTVLANEEIVDGKSERGGHPVVRLPLRQWMLRITAYADRLDADLASLDWPDTKAKQHHWIGRSEGAVIDFAVDAHDGGGPAGTAGARTIRVFTTRVDTLAGATYVVLAPEHPLTLELATDAQRGAVRDYVEATKKKSDIDRSDLTKTKTGVPLGAFAINPANGDRIPIWTGDYVIGTYGTGAVMAVPAHDERDHAFAKAYGLPIVQVIAPPEAGHVIDVQREAFTDDGVAWHQRTAAGIADGTPSEETRAKMTAWLKEKGQGDSRVTYKLRDWVFSRQRYWGEPIPIYFPVETAGDPRLPGATFTIDYDHPIPVAESELPLRLPDLEDFQPGDDPAGPLARAADWRFFQKDGKWFARETNTMPQWAGSCWYYLRFLDPHNDQEPFSKEAYDAWMPVDLYVGGSEHAVLHLLYARFWHKVLFDLGIVNGPEPFLKLVHQGTILGENNEKMSKSRGNVVNPDDVVKSHGADALRLYEMFMGPLEATKPWQTSAIEGVSRFLERVWNLATRPMTDDPAKYDLETKRLVHKTIEKVTGDIEGLRFNTAISQMMILVKHLGQLAEIPREAAKALALIVSPFAPHLGEEAWERLGSKKSLALEAWPAFDPALVKDDTREIGVQVNGKVRGVVAIAVNADEATAQAAALKDPKVAAHVEGKTVKKFIYVPGKIINLIVA